MGAIESGPMACIKLVHVAQVKVENFQNGLQFYISSAELQPRTGHIDLPQTTLYSPTDHEGHRSAAAPVLDRKT